MTSLWKHKNLPLYLAIAAGGVFLVAAAIALPGNVAEMGGGLKGLLIGSAVAFVLLGGVYVARK